jgi:hypothetical protein
MIKKKLIRIFNEWTWLFGILMGLTVALGYIGIKQLKANDDVIHYTVNVPISEENKIGLRELVEENPGKDIILVPDEPIDVLPGEDRRLRDEERAEKEAQEYQAAIAAGIEAGTIINSDKELACEIEAEAIGNDPSLYLLCGFNIVSAPSNTSFTRGSTTNDAEALLTTYVLELLGNVTSTNHDAGYESYFSGGSVLNTLTFTTDGNVNLDFNEEFAEQYGHLHGSNAERMLEQLNRTIFQFREVNSVSVTLNGSCEAFAQLFEFSCVNLDRNTWQHMLELNNAQVQYFNLVGGQ